MPYADNGSARLHWEERGEGTPVVLVMGHTYDSAMWYPVVDVLAQHHRVITLDNRGTGKSSRVRRISLAVIWTSPALSSGAMALCASLPPHALL